MKKIAVPVTSNNKIDDHFGHCEFYRIFTISETNEIVGEKNIKADEGCGCKSNIANVLAEQDVTIMLAGGIGGGAINVLKNAGIEVVRGCSGIPEEVVKQYIAGSVIDSGESCKTHEEHHGQANENKHICNH